MMSDVIKVGSFLLWVNDIEYVQATKDSTGTNYIKIMLKSGTSLKVDTYADEVDKLKDEIYHAMIKAQNTKDGEYNEVTMGKEYRFNNGDKVCIVVKHPSASLGVHEHSGEDDV